MMVKSGVLSQNRSFLYGIAAVFVLLVHFGGYLPSETGGGYNNSEQTAPRWAVGCADFRLFIWNKLLLFLEQRNTPKCILEEQNQKNVHSLPDYIGKL